MNEVTLRKWYDVFKDNNELVEIRILDPVTKKSYSGYFTDIDTIIKEIRRYEHCNIYFTLNVINEACYSREQHNIISTKPKAMTSDDDIIGRKWCLIDIDCVKPSDTNSTDAEKELAKEVVNNVYKFLRDQGFEQPIICDSSNGFHLTYKQAMLASSENTEISKNFLKVLSMLFSTDKVKVDCANYNNSRICKLYGVMSRKGADTIDRPQRESKILRIPDEIKVTKNEYFEKVANMLPKKEQPTRYNNYSSESFDLDAFIEKYGIKVRNIISEKHYTKYVLEECPFSSNHTAPDSAFFKMDNGAIGFKCLHNSDSDKTWQDVRRLFEPDAYVKQNYNNPRSFRPYNQKERAIIVEQQKDENKGSVWQTMAEIEDEDRSKIISIPSGILQYDKECCGFDKPSLSVWSGSNGCVDCDTEFFNGERWKRIADYNYGEKVLQYNDNGSATLVYPSIYHKYRCNKLTLMTSPNGSINQCLSDEHNLVYITSKGNLHKRNFMDFKNNNGCGCDFIPYFKYNTDGINWTDNEILLGLAVSAEGHLFEKRKNTKHRVRVNLKHKYKKDELVRLLVANSIEYEVKKYNPHDFEDTTFLFYWDKSFKKFPKSWYGMNERQKLLVRDNITKWDGRVQEGRGGTYSTTIKENADLVQFIITSTGFRCGISIDSREFRKNVLYILTFSKNRSLIKCRKNLLKFEEYKTSDGYKYCFTVESGMLVLRRNMNINITGNSAKSTLLNQIALNALNKGFKVALYSGELRNKKLKRWMLYQAAGKSYNVKSQYNDYDYYTPNKIKDKIVDWMGDKIYNYNTKYSHNIEQVCKEVEKIVKEKQVDMIIMDNLSCLDIDELDGALNEQQKTAIKMLLRLSDKLEVALHIVVHPRKSLSFLRKDDISGSKTITDLADNVFIVHRWNLDTQRAAKDFLEPTVYNDIMCSGASNLVEVVKQREFGDAEGHIYKLYFETESKRLKNFVAENIIYGWREQGTQQNIEYSSSNYEPQDTDDFFTENNEVPF